MCIQVTGMLTTCKEVSDETLCSCLGVTGFINFTIPFQHLTFCVGMKCGFNSWDHLCGPPVSVMQVVIGEVCH